MDPLDKEKVQAVWQRVTARPASLPEVPPEPPDLPQQWLTTAGLYDYLARHLGGGTGRELEGLARQTRQDAACLRGLARMAGNSSRPHIAGMQMPRSAAAGLQLAVRREQAQIAALASLADGLAPLLAEHCQQRRMTLLILLGRNSG